MGRSTGENSRATEEEMKPLRLAPEALDELMAAAEWYDVRRGGLGDRFLDEVGFVLQAIESRPASFPQLADTTPDLEIRRALLPRFPYALVFLELTDEIRIVAVAHAKREPNYWLNRVR
jgi:plasmid stabilization system protein ParE